MCHHDDARQRRLLGIGELLRHISFAFVAVQFQGFRASRLGGPQIEAGGQTALDTRERPKKKRVFSFFFYCYYSLWFVIRKRDLKMISGLKCLDFSRHRREGRVVSADWETQRKKAKEMLQSRKKIVSSLLTCLVVVCRLPFRSVKSFFQDFQFN